MFGYIARRFAPGGMPQLVEIEPARGCNLRCIMCHVPHMKEKAQFLDIDALERNTKSLRGCHVIIGSEYEPTIHPEFERLLRLAVKRQWKVDFLTNGSNLHRYDPALLSDVQFHVFNVSFDGFSKSSYENVRRGADYEQTITNIRKAAAAARQSGAYTAVNATLMRSNLDETTDLVRMWDSEGFDLVRLLLVQIRAADIASESLYPILPKTKEVLNRTASMVADEKMRIGVRCGFFGSAAFVPPDGAKVNEATVSSANPSHRHVPGVRQDFQSGEWPGMPWPCKSPFVYARIRWDGGVDLCNKRDFVIGNIYDDKFHRIWRGHQATEQRRRIQEDRGICESCDYFRFCINIRHLEIEALESHFAAGLLRDPTAAESLNPVIAGR